MESEEAISWRTIYWKLIGFFLLGALTLTALGIIIAPQLHCNSWYLHSCFAPGGALKQPFGDSAPPVDAPVDLVLWAVFAVMFFMWLTRRFFMKNYMKV